MIISKTPYRISLVGGGTDLPEFFENHEDGGAVISFPINKYIYICINNLFEGNGYFLKYSNIERINSIASSIVILNLVILGSVIVNFCFL